MKFLLISPKNRTTYNFRGDLIRKIREMGYEVIVTGPDRENVEAVEALGVRFFEVAGNKNGTSVFGDLAYYKQLKKLIRQEKPDVVLSYTVKPVVYGTLAAKKSGVKNVNCLVTGAGYTFTSRSFKAKIINRIVTFLYKKALKKADNVIFQNPDDRNEFVGRKLVKRDKTYVVNGSGVNLERFDHSGYPAAVTFLMVSRLLHSKGVAEYLRAAEKVKGAYPETVFRLLGKYETSMSDRIPKEEIEPYISRGIVERFDETDDVLRFYSGCSVYVLPSYREGVPRTVLEAMACRRPIITTNANGCRETVVDGYNGFLIEPRDSDGLADAMIRFIREPELIAAYGENSRQLCTDKFDVEKVNAEMIKIMNLQGEIK